MKKLLLISVVLMLIHVSFVFGQCNFPINLKLQHDPNWASIGQTQAILLAREAAILDAKTRTVERIIGIVVENITHLSQTTISKISRNYIIPTSLVGVKHAEELDVIDTRYGLVCATIKLQRTWAIKSIEKNLRRTLNDEEYNDIKHMLPATILIQGLASWTPNGKKVVNAIAAAMVDARAKIAARLFGEVISSSEKVQNFVMQDITRKQQVLDTLLIGCEVKAIELPAQVDQPVRVTLRLPKSLYIYSISQKLKQLGLELDDRDYEFIETMEPDNEKDNTFEEKGNGLLQ